MSFVRFYGILGFPDVSIVNNLPANAGDAGDMGLIPGSGIPSGGGNYNPLQYFFSENLTGRQQSQFSSVQLLHRVRLFVTPWTAAHLRGASSAPGKGLEEGGLAYAKAGSSLKSLHGNSRASTPQNQSLPTFCFHLHLWLYGGLSPTTSLWKKS